MPTHVPAHNFVFIEENFIIYAFVTLHIEKGNYSHLVRHLKQIDTQVTRVLFTYSFFFHFFAIIVLLLLLGLSLGFFRNTKKCYRCCCYNCCCYNTRYLICLTIFFYFSFFRFVFSHLFES